MLTVNVLVDSRFHYDTIKKRYGNKARLLFTDTDSLMYQIETEDVYNDMWEMKDLFDFSEYPVGSPYHDETNKKVIGKMKDELSGEIIFEFVGLRPKMYSIQTIKTVNDEAIYTDKHRAKGIQREEAAKLRHEQYKKQLDNPEENYVTTRRLGAKLHKIYAIEVCVLYMIPYQPYTLYIQLQLSHTHIT